jgi:hypothetical protein
MEIELKASTNDIKDKEGALELARAAARVCYTKKDFEQLVEEEDSHDLVARLVNSGHHSPFDHIQLGFYFKGLPKIGAMILNNEKAYTTSEKSARYTVMKDIDPEQKALFDKWMPILEQRIHKQYGYLNEEKTKKLAQENARYMTSVFTPTKMFHTMSFRQLNYFMHWFDDFMESAPDTSFNVRLKEFMEGFNSQLRDDWYLEADGERFKKNLNPVLKKRALSLFKDSNMFPNQFDVNYSTHYKISFAGLAQEHRHRTLNYSIQPIEDGVQPEFFVPPILRDDPTFVKEWLSDIRSVAKTDFPQGQLVDVFESGLYSDFISKMAERMCGHAQWEIMDQTRKTLNDYIEATENGGNYWIASLLKQHANGPKCTFPGSVCTEPCPFGSKYGLERLV